MGLIPVVLAGVGVSAQSIPKRVEPFTKSLPVVGRRIESSKIDVGFDSQEHQHAPSLLPKNRRNSFLL